MHFVAKFESTLDRVRQLFSSPRALLFVSVIVIAWRLLDNSSADPDLFARIAMGRLVEKLSGVPLYDPFAFTTKLPIWIDHEWLSGVVFYQVLARLGEAGLIALKIIVAAWTCLLLVRASMLYSPQAAGRIVWAVACILEASFLWASTVRCQVFTYFFIALTYYAVAQYRVNGVSRYLVLIPIGCIALVNMHGGYALEVLILWIVAVASFVQGKPWKVLAAVAALASLAPACTPYGFQAFVSYLVHALTMDRPSISEWAPLYRDLGPLIRTGLITVPLGVGVVLALRKKECDLTALALLGFSFYCGFSHVRFIGFAMLTALVFGAAYFGRTVELARSMWRSRMMMVERSLAAVGAVVILIMLVEMGRASLRVDSWRMNVGAYPIRAVEWLRQTGAAGTLLVDFNNGSFALWRLYPRFLVSIDGRYEEVYTNQTVKDAALAFSPNTPEGLAALQRIAPTHILLNISVRSPDAQRALSAEWREVYRDEGFVLYTSQGSHPTHATPARAALDIWEPLF
jgi:hypothetical protein